MGVNTKSEARGMSGAGIVRRLTPVAKVTQPA